MASTQDKTSKSKLSIAAVAIFYGTVSISLVLLNKTILRDGGFPFPLFVTYIQFVFALLFAVILGEVRGWTNLPIPFQPFRPSLHLLKAVFPLTIIYVSMIALSNICLRFVQASFYNVARSMHIPFSVFFLWSINGVKLPSKILLACLVIVGGYFIGSIGELKFTWEGAIFGFLASAFTALYPMFVKEKLKIMDDFLLLDYNTLIALVLMLPIMVLNGEVPGVFEEEKLYTWEFWSSSLITSFVGFFINIAAFLNIKYTTPLTHMVAGCVKAAVQSYLGVLLFGDVMSPINVIGTVITLGGSFMYSLIKYWDMQAKDEERKKQEESKKEE